MSFDYTNMFNDPPQDDPTQACDTFQSTVDQNPKKLSSKESIGLTNELWGRTFEEPQEGDKRSVTKKVVYKYDNDKLDVYTNPTLKQLEDALAKGDIADFTPDGKGGGVLRLPSGTNIPGTKPVVVHNPDGTTTTSTSVKFETLSDKELAALRAQIKARIVYLKLSDPDNKDKKESELKYLQTLLKFVESEEALRNKKPEEFKRLNGKQINTISKMEAKWSALRAMQNANQEIREARAEEKQETVRVIVKQKVMKEEIIKEGVLFARILGKTVLESKEAKESNEEAQNGSKVKTVDYVSISPTINKNPRRVFVNMGSLLIRYRSI